MSNDDYKTLAEWQQVAFTQVRSEKGWQAAEVKVLETTQTDGVSLAALNQAPCENINRKKRELF